MWNQGNGKGGGQPGNANQNEGGWWSRPRTIGLLIFLMLIVTFLYVSRDSILSMTQWSMGRADGSPHTTLAPGRKMDTYVVPRPKPPRRDVFCPAIWDPVCGADDNTYPNMCELEAHGMTLKHRGPCRRDAHRDGFDSR